MTNKVKNIEWNKDKKKKAIDTEPHSMVKMYNEKKKRPNMNGSFCYFPKIYQTS